MKTRLTWTSTCAALVAWLAPSSALADTITVSPGDDYAKIEAAQPGDIVEIEPGTYKFRVYLSKQATAAQPIVIRAADPSNRPVWDLDGQNVEDWPGSYTGGDNGRGCWQVTGSHYQISGIVFTNCHSSSGNSAGIRTNASESLTVKDALFKDNNVGFSGAGENTIVEFSEFDGNGRVSSPPQHSTYIYGGSFTLRYSYVHDSVGGQNLHIRARDSVIEYNWIARANNYEIDMMTGNDLAHSMLLRGNVVLGNLNPENGSTLITLYNDSGTAGVSMNLVAVHNTFVVQSSSNPNVVSVRNDTMQSASVVLSNNIVVGTSKAFGIREPGTANWSATGTNNWFETGADVGDLTATVFGADPGFNAAGSMDFTLGAGSTAIGAADVGIGDAPDQEYFRNEVDAMMFRWRAAIHDIGAFESTTTGGGFGPYDDPGTGGSAGSAGSAGSGGTAGSSGTGGAGGAGPGGTGGTSSAGVAGTGGATGGSGGTTAGTGGTSGGASSSPTGEDDGGCGCDVPGHRNGGAPLAGLASLVALVVFRRRRA